MNICECFLRTGKCGLGVSECICKCETMSVPKCACECVKYIHVNSVRVIAATCTHFQERGTRPL